MRFDGTGTPDTVDKDQLKQLLSRGWMTHDGMWFAQVLGHAGIEVANQLNKAAIRAMAPIEVKRMKRVLGLERVASAAQLQEFYAQALSLVIGDFMAFDWDWAEDGFEVTVERCFAHEGMEMLGCADRYECGIFERILAWLDALGIENRVEPHDPLCAMHHQGWCRKQVFFQLPAVGQEGS